MIAPPNRWRLRSADNPMEAVLELHVDGVITWLALNRDELLDLAKAAQDFTERLKPSTRIGMGDVGG